MEDFEQYMAKGKINWSTRRGIKRIQQSMPTEKVTDDKKRERKRHRRRKNGNGKRSRGM